jgi:hypothetical protein
MGQLKEQALIEPWRLTRRKLGFGLPGLGDFHLMIEVKDLAQLEQAFERVARRSEPVESMHFGVNSLAQNAVFALYRDFLTHSAIVGRSDFSPTYWGVSIGCHKMCRNPLQ